MQTQITRICKTVLTLGAAIQLISSVTYYVNIQMLVISTARGGSRGCPWCPDTRPLLTVPFLKRTYFQNMLLLAEQDASPLMIFEQRCAILINFRIKFNLITVLASYLKIYYGPLAQPPFSCPCGL